MVMGPPPERGAAAEQFSFGAQMAGMLRSTTGNRVLHEECVVCSLSEDDGNGLACATCV